jgi:hypothetical protein
MAQIIPAQRAREIKPHKSSTEIMENLLKREKSPRADIFMNFSFGES